MRRGKHRLVQEVCNVLTTRKVNLEMCSWLANCLEATHPETFQLSAGGQIV